MHCRRLGGAAHNTDLLQVVALADDADNFAPLAFRHGKRSNIVISHELDGIVHGGSLGDLPLDVQVAALCEGRVGRLVEGIVLELLKVQAHRLFECRKKDRKWREREVKVSEWSTAPFTGLALPAGPTSTQNPRENVLGPKTHPRCRSGGARSGHAETRNPASNHIAFG